MSAHRPPGVNAEGGEGSSVQLLTGGRRVSQASPTLSLGNSGTVAFRHRGDSKLDKFQAIHQKSGSFPSLQIS